MLLLPQKVTAIFLFRINGQAKAVCRCCLNSLNLIRIVTFYTSISYQVLHNQDILPDCTKQGGVIFQVFQAPVFSCGRDVLWQGEFMFQPKGVKCSCNATINYTVFSFFHIFGKIARNNVFPESKLFAVVHNPPVLSKNVHP